ncbi:MAG: DoxX family membrane protein [Phycisphaerae bacterium]|nr:DoxX family membrane protein [Phycisphaerae bacterium]
MTDTQTTEAPTSKPARTCAAAWLLGNRTNLTLCRFGLLLLRLAVGAIFVAHGLQKCFPLWGSAGFAGAEGAAMGTGLEPVVLWAVLLVVAELGGGALLLLGLATRIGAAMTGAVMIVALATVHAEDSLLATHVQQMLLVASVVLVVAGGGMLSVWSGRRKR